MNLTKIIVFSLSLTLLVSAQNNNIELIKSRAYEILTHKQEKDVRNVLGIIDSLHRYKISEFTPQLIEMYKNGCNNYPGNQGVIRNKILRLLILTNDPRGEQLFIDIINSNVIGPELRSLLEYLQFYKNPSEKLISALKNLKLKIENLMKTAPESKYPVYSNIISTIEICLSRYQQ